MTISSAATRCNARYEFRKILKIAVFCLAWVGANATLCQALNQTDSSVPAGVSLAHFAQLDNGVYVGSKPRTGRDFAFLQSLHIRYIVDARFLPFLSGSEKRNGRRYGMTLITVPMNASPIPPFEKHVNRILFTIRDPQFHPVYVHCVLGRDRTNLIAGLYKIYFLSVPKRKAWQEMKQDGFPSWWFVHGLTVYFHRHAGRRTTGSGS